LPKASDRVAANEKQAADLTEQDDQGYEYQGYEYHGYDDEPLGYDERRDYDGDFRDSEQRLASASVVNYNNCNNSDNTNTD